MNSRSLQTLYNPSTTRFLPITGTRSSVGICLKQRKYAWIDVGPKTAMREIESHHYRRLVARVMPFGCVFLL